MGSNASLLFIFLLIAPCTLGWYTKGFTTESYNKMEKETSGTLRNLKEITIGTHIDWDSLDRGFHFGRIFELFNITEKLEVINFQQQFHSNTYKKFKKKSMEILRLINLNEIGEKNGTKFDE